MRVPKEKTQHHEKNGGEAELSFLKNFIDLSTDILCNLNKSGICTYMNKAFERHTGYRAVEVIGKHFSDFVHPEYLEDTMLAFSRRTTDQATPALTSCLISKSGESVYIEWTGKNAGRAGIFLAGRNVSERIKISREVEEKNRLLLSITQSMPVVIFLYNLTEGRLEFISDHVYQMTGYTSAECLGMNQAELAAIIPSPDEEKMKKGNGESHIGNFRIRTKDGELRRANSREIIFKRDAQGKATHILGSLTDITEQFDAERYKEAIIRLKEIQLKRTQKIRSLSLLQGQEEERKRLARELHDGIGQLLTAIKIKLNEVDEKEGPPQFEKAIADIKSIVHKTIQETRNISYALVPIDLYDFGLDAALKQLCESARRNSGKEISYTSNLSGERLHPTIEIELYRIVQEAMNNSIKYSGAEAIDIRMTCNEEKGSLKVLIIDDGQGFDYDPDYIYKKNKTRSFGLRNMNERTRIINGKLNIISRKGEGCVISVELPLKLNEI